MIVLSVHLYFAVVLVILWATPAVLGVNLIHPEWATYLRVLLTLHISCGVVSFVCAPVALATVKGGKVHRRFGKIYFWAMAGVAVTALILSLALPVYFLARFRCSASIRRSRRIVFFT